MGHEIRIVGHTLLKWVLGAGFGCRIWIHTFHPNPRPSHPALGSTSQSAPIPTHKKSSLIDMSTMDESKDGSRSGSGSGAISPVRFLANVGDDGNPIESLSVSVAPPRRQ